MYVLGLIRSYHRDPCLHLHLYVHTLANVDVITGIFFSRKKCLCCIVGATATLCGPIFRTFEALIRGGRVRFQRS